MSEPKRNHYNPQFYLKNFADERGRIWVFDRKIKQYRHQHIRDTAVQKNYYRVKTKDGGYSTEVEQFFSLVEGRASVAIDKVIKGESISEQEKGNIALFASFQYTRVPDFEKVNDEMTNKAIKHIDKMKFHSVEATKAILEKLREETGGEKDGNVTAEEMYEFIQSGKYSVKYPREHTIKIMLDMGQHAAGYFIQMDWRFIYTPASAAFITTDNPFTLIPPKDYDPNSFWGVGILTPGAKKALPIASNVSLFMDDRGDKIEGLEVSNDAVQGINILYARTSDRFIFAREESLLREIVKLSRVEEMLLDRERIRIS